MMMADYSPAKIVVTLEQLPIEVISTICSFLPSFSILTMERISSTLCRMMLSSNVYMKRIFKREEYVWFTHTDLMVKDISLFADKVVVPLLYRMIFLAKLMLQRSFRTYYNLMWSKGVKEGFIK